MFDVLHIFIYLLLLCLCFLQLNISRSVSRHFNNIPGAASSKGQLVPPGPPGPPGPPLNPTPPSPLLPVVLVLQNEITMDQQQALCKSTITMKIPQTLPVTQCGFICLRHIWWKLFVKLGLGMTGQGKFLVLSGVSPWLTCSLYGGWC